MTFHSTRNNQFDWLDPTSADSADANIRCWWLSVMCLTAAVVFCSKVVKKQMSCRPKLKTDDNEKQNEMFFVLFKCAL